ncbi:2,3,4,5-tetrahydropyridine-2,6-dicarboxylate N-succinyltransferase [Oxalobacter formigenes]|uniref:2,3,4,5-tetrahydropyridine-2,6-dicarboxylate N-succinyltransferase n=1 Tax=Oxalobacter formigenes OXCC13 TaxID=556269 RepID=C3XAF2_OXAFO|nr:2,3,4,5-tetrahydropyridine-2,6-dicarboxylate N-succinyltransferase [Oxalobacter formigenes]ARQ45674.1 2,3,4,5-tetrahydropyridine-2,6-dicarboxylate N-succinyltransferase [Oxalobacter formigenes]ARQ77914.1 2,3,4,5-tetrahydropyridine-2,6-dicarboxylate N-succinyltransferase [Oxalobacter formigenes OXCC13]EEO30178.1 2,3,4,5-tetrahydropyridine-2,6-dicarboxylate N-succinyltransferase [Oxalobacter formigenes OXCC13]MCZ4063073.1 2,3,4,5-tetrahydropyridine-2,6-dicarboxylate N-succinyltransferase [Oxal
MSQEEQLKQIIEEAWENRDSFAAGDTSPILRAAIAEVIRQLDCGQLRVAEKKNGEWIVNQWTKKAVLLSFRLQENFAMPVGADGSPALHFYDKVTSKFANYTQEDFAKAGFRVVPPAVARLGSYIGKNVVMMPSFVNIGAYVGEGTMIDTWATVGSCAQIGKHVHLSGGVGIGGVLEPMQANPTIIEDNCFIGARSEIVEGVIVEENSVISMGVYIGQSTRIYDRENDRILYGRVPSGSVVVPGNIPDPGGKYSLYCAVIVKRVNAVTRAKTAINDLLRDN